MLNAARFALSSKRCTGLAIWLFANSNTYLGGSGILMRPNGMNNKGLLTDYRQPKLAWRALGRLLKG